MTTLKLLGGASVMGPDAPLLGLIAQRHRLAVLALVARARTGLISRDKLLAYLWSDAEPEKARRSLSNALYVIRQAVGEDAVQAVGDDLRLNTAVVRVDANDFEQAAEAGRLDEAASLYTGPFLDGVHLKHEPEFERWVDQERRNLRATYLQVLESLAERGQTDGDWVAVVRWRRRMAGEDPYSSRIALKLMEGLAESGCAPEAIRHARIYSALIEDECGAEPDPAVAALADRLRHHAKRASAVAGPASQPVATGDSPSAVASDASKAVTPDTVERKPEGDEVGARLIGPGLLVAAVVGILTFGGLYRSAYPPPITTPHDTRAEALAMGREFLTAMGAAGSFREVAVHRGEMEVGQRTFLERTLGVTEARRRVSAGLPLGHWRLRWFQPGHVEEWEVAVDRGDVLEFEHVLPEAAPGRDLTSEAARGVADSFLVARGWSLNSLRTVEASSAERPNRTDHHFVWEEVGSAIMWAELGGGSDAGVIRVSVDVKGDQVGGYRHYFRVPVGFRQTSRRSALVQSAVIDIVIVAGLLLALAYAIAGSRAGAIRWKPALLAAAVASLLLAAAHLNAWDTAWYEASALTPSFVFWRQELLWVLFIVVVAGGAMALWAAAGEWLARTSLPRVLAGYHALLGGRPSSPAVTRVVLRGYALGAVLLGAEAVVVATARAVPGVWFSEEFLGFTGVLNRAVPAAELVETYGAVIGTGLIGMFTVGLLKRHLRSTALAVAASTLLFAFGTAQVRPLWLGGAVATITIGLLTVGLLRFGIVAFTVANLVWQALPPGVGLLAAGQPDLVAAGVVALLLVLAPAALLLQAWRTETTRPHGPTKRPDPSVDIEGPSPFGAR